MSLHNPTMEELRRAGMEALARALGPAGMARFIQQFETGWGDYSTARHQWLDQADVQTLARNIRQRRQSDEPEVE
jgi:hypothetical protein